MQRTNPSLVPEPGINDDLIYGKVKCDTDQEKYYNPRCFTFEGSGNPEDPSASLPRPLTFVYTYLLTMGSNFLGLAGKAILHFDM